MKRSNLETTVLILGLIIIGLALFFMFFTEDTYQSLFISNIIFSVGFLIYIIYSMMTANSLNREIRQNQSHIAHLKEELRNRDKQLAEQQKRIDALEEEKLKMEAEKAALEEDLSTSNTEVEKLQREIAELRSSQNQP